MVSKIEVDEITNQSGDQDSGLDLSTNDNIKFKIANSQKAVIDATGNVGVGTSSPTAQLEIEGNVSSTTQFSGFQGLRIQNANGSAHGVTSDINLVCGTASDNRGAVIGAEFTSSASGNDLYFATNPNNVSSNDTPTERLRIKSNGVVMIPGTHSDTSSSERVSISVTSGSTNGINFIPTNSSGGIAIATRTTGGSGVGGVSFNSSSTSFNTSSDYRLKENVTTSWDATTRLKQLKPSRFNFKVDKDTTLDGFLAHEVSSIVPEAINGEKDAVDKSGNIEPQSIDQSKLVPLLTKALQEAVAKIETLEAKVTALESK